jgi:hypothetical protein
VLQKPFNELLACTEVRVLQAIERKSEICKAVLRCVRQNAQRSQDRKPESPGLLASLSIVHQQTISGQLSGERDSLALAGAEGASQRDRVLRALNVQPLGRARKPRLDEIRSAFPAELRNDSRWYDHAPVEGRQHVNVVNEN